MNGTGPHRQHRNTCVTPIASTGAGCCAVDAVYDLSELVEEEGIGEASPVLQASTPLTCENIATIVNSATTRMDAGESRYADVAVLTMNSAKAQDSQASDRVPNTISPASPAPARAARKLAKLQRKVLAWWDSVPADARRTHYLGAQLARGVGIPVATLGPALKSLGWRREQVRLAGEQVGVWCSPGAPSIKRPRGRPPVPQLAPGGQP